MTALIAAAFTLAVLPLSPGQGGGHTLPQAPKEPSHRAVSRADKLARAKAQLNLPTLPTGIVDSLELSCRTPFVSNKGSLQFTLCDSVRSDEVSTGFATMSPRPPASGSPGATSGAGSTSGGGAAPARPFLGTVLLIGRPNKVHTATFYFHSLGPQKVEISSEGAFPLATFNVPAGDQSLFYAFQPTRSGRLRIVLMPKEKQMTFYKVEIDVMQ